MKDLLSGLDELGFSELEDMEVFKAIEAAGSNGEAAAASITTNVVPIDDCVYDKKYTCPVCDRIFKEKTVKTTKLRFVDVDLDLMPRYTPLLPFYYNVVICDKCGYAALADSFLKLTESQGDLIRNQITPKFTKKEYPFPFTEDVAIERYKFALLNSVVKRGRVSEKAYICLVISWLYKLKNDEENWILFVKNAHDAFESAYGTDTFPFYGMNEIVTAYLIGELARCIGDNEGAMRWVSRVLSSRLATAKVKDMAIELKSRIAKGNRIS